MKLGSSEGLEEPKSKRQPSGVICPTTHIRIVPLDLLTLESLLDFRDTVVEK